MRPDDLRGLATVVAVLVLLGLLLPKREWRTIPTRLRLVAEGGRRHLFGPLAHSSRLGAPPLVRPLLSLRAELRQAFELGVPLLLAAMWTEARGAAHRTAADQEWRESSSGLLLRHLGGEMTEEDFQQRLHERGLPSPAPALTWTPARPFTMPPMRWRREWDLRLEELRREAATANGDDRPGADEAPAAQDPSPLPEAKEVAIATMPRVEIRTLGEVRVLVDGQDIAAGLLHRPAVACTVLYLVAREVRRPRDRITRAAFADELFPGAIRDKRHKLSRRLSALKNQDLPRQLGQRIRIDGEYVNLDLAGCDVDARSVLDVATEVATGGREMSEIVHESAERAQRLAMGEFLPGWEEVELRGTGGGSGMNAVVEEVRDRIIDARLAILDALADLHLVQGRPDEAVRHLEDALRCRPERVKVARRLADVYERSGQPQHAARLRQEYGIGEAS